MREVYNWILGRLSTADWADVRLVLPYVVVAVVVLLLHRRHLDLLRVGDDEAADARRAGRPGAPRRRDRGATLGTAAVVSVSGLIGFVGIIVPHAVRLVAGSSYRRLLPLSLMFGAAFLILADIPGAGAHDPAETPIGVVTAFLGAPFFIVVLRDRGAATMSSLELRGVGVRYGRARSPWRRSRDLVAVRGVARPDRPQRRRQVVAAAGRRRARRVDRRGRRRRRTAVAAVAGGGGPRSSPTCRRRRSMPDDMTGFEYVLLGRTPYVGYFGTESRHDQAMVGDVLERLDLRSSPTRRLGTLSGGERQRLVIARALAQEAPILLLDEPTSALDIGHQQQALSSSPGCAREHGLTVVSAMHDLTLAGLYSDRLALLHEGQSWPAGRPPRCCSAETLAEFYGVRVSVHHEPDGTVVVIPRRVSPVGVETPRAQCDSEVRSGLEPGVAARGSGRPRPDPTSPRKYGWTGPGSSSAGCTTRHVRSTTSSRAKRRGEPSMASPSSRS